MYLLQNIDAVAEHRIKLIIQQVDLGIKPRRLILILPSPKTSIWKTWRWMEMQYCRFYHFSCFGTL